MHFRSFIAGGLFAAVGLASADDFRLLYQGNGSTTWLENLRIRSNGLVLTTSIGPPANLFQFDPSQKGQEPVLLGTFPAVEGLSGITEVSHDVLYITGSNTTGSDILDPPKNSTHVWKVDFNGGRANKPYIELIVRPKFPVVTYFNGFTTFNEHIILGSSSFESTVVALDIRTGHYWTALNDSSMSDINGIKASDDGYLYWTSSSGLFRAHLYKNLTIGAAEPLYTGSYDDFQVSYDGFALAKDGTRYAYMASNTDQIQQVIFDDATGTVSSTSYVAGTTNATTWGKSTGCDFGRTKAQKNKVYCTTGGSLTAGSSIGGQLFEITVYNDTIAEAERSHGRSYGRRAWFNLM